LPYVFIQKKKIFDIHIPVIQFQFTQYAQYTAILQYDVVPYNSMHCFDISIYCVGQILLHIVIALLSTGW